MNPPSDKTESIPPSKFILPEIRAGNVLVNMEEFLPLSKPPPPELPARYYLDHFEEMLAFVAARYDHALEDRHRDFLAGYRTLSEGARCLYVRIANRRGRLFHRDHLRYKEIDLDAAIAELLAHEFLSHPVAVDFAALLALAPRTDLVARLRSRREGSGDETFRYSSAKKQALIRHALATLSFEEAFPQETRTLYLAQDREEEVAYLLYLYFGSVHRDLTTFALRDLGRVRTAPFRTDFQPRFNSGEAARACFFYSQMLDLLEAAEAGKPMVLYSGVEAWPVVDEAEPGTLRHRALHRLGRLLERDGSPEEALDTYQRSDQYPSTERTVRLLLNADRRDEAEALLRRLIDDPSCDAELLFAEDFLERKFQKKKQGRLTAFLRSAPILLLDESGRDRPEAAAVARLRRDGAEAIHSENRIWLQLFGLLFWDLLFGSELASLHDPFDFTPQDLATGTFFERHRQSLLERFVLLDDPEAALAHLDAVWTSHRGEPNSVVAWDEALYAFTRALVAKAPPGGLAVILEAMARDHRQNRSGFPDLIIFENGEPRFLEIKTEGDQIRRQQMVQIERLSRAGFEVSLANVRWTFDAGQEYVVVDLETTGGDPSSNRITEIGAVKVRDGRIVEEWTSLVKPGRRIPPFIVKLTGITDEMVATAPEFAAIAAELRAFIGEAVFVAHRAKFDHGFLKAEFDRVGIHLAGPVLCTVVEMKRHFPGLASYGLGALSAHFGIPLESHHRALCDARATAELLLRINEKRLATHSPDSGDSGKVAQKRD